MQGPAIHHTNWQPQYPADENITYEDLVKTAAEFTALKLASIRRQMKPEEDAHFDAQLQNEQHKMMEIDRCVIALQAFPIGNPDAVPKRQYQKKKIYRKANI